MGSTKKGRFSRPTGGREYRKVLTLFTEGKKTENCYFYILRKNRVSETVNIIVKKGNDKTEPSQVLNRAKKHIGKNGLSENEQVWLVIDVDGRPEKSFTECFKWDADHPKYNLAMSNPNFEYWLLMHFESGDDVKDVNDLMMKLKQYLPHYTKSNIGAKHITRERCRAAINNGKKRKHEAGKVLQGCASSKPVRKNIFYLTTSPSIHNCLF